MRLYMTSRIRVKTMSKVYFISDLHIGHKNILGFSPMRGGANINEHDEWILDRICSVVNKRDTLWILGDVCFDIQKIGMLGRIPCRKNLILGNHDKFQMGVYQKHFSRIHGFMTYRGCWLSHAPLHPVELRGRRNIHGHVHMNTIRDAYHQEDPRYINVCVEASNGRPRTYEELTGR